MGAQVDAAQAVIQGREAATAGEPVTTCPYPRTSLLRTAWVKGYAHAARARETGRADE